MPTITSIKPQKSGKRVNIYLDNKFGFGLDLENYLKLSLKVEQELTEDEIEKIVKKAEFQKTLDKLLRFATLRPRSEKEIKGYFKRKKVHPSLTEELFSRLNRLDLVDDKKFAQWWIEQRQTFKPKSLRILNNELRIKGIKKETIQEVLSDIRINETEIVKQLLEKKSYRWKNLPEREAKQKAYEYLSRKGFSWEMVKNLLDDFLKFDGER